MNILGEIRTRLMTAENHKKLFSSNEYCTFLQKKIIEVCKDWNQYRSDLFLKYEDSDVTAYTDNLHITLNAGSPLFLGEDLKECFLIQNGAVFHELGHRLFTMFGGMESYTAALKSGCFYPCRPSLDAEYEEQIEKVEKYIGKKNQAALLEHVMYSILNCIEDGRIENILLSFLVKYTNMHTGLNLLRKKLYDESPSYEEIREKVEMKEWKSFLALQQLILYYGRFGEIKGYVHAMHRKDELIQKFDSIKEDLDNCLDTTNEQVYFSSLNNILVFLIDDILEYINQCREEIEEKMKEQSQQSQQGSSGGSKKKASGGLTQEIAKQILSSMQAEQGKLSASTVTPNGKSNPGESIPQPMLDAKKQDNGQDDAKKPPYTRTNSITETFGTGKIENIEEYIEACGAGKDLSWLGKLVLESEETENLRLQIEKDLREFNANINFPKIHQGVNAKFYRHKVTEQNKKDYLEIGKDAEKLATLMARKSNNYQDPDSELPIMRYSGSRFKASELYKNNFKYFEKDLIPQESPSLSVALVIDESGSMGGKKIKYARQLALTTYLYCEKINAKTLIIGHSTYDAETGVEIMSYADFDKKDANDKYRIMNIKARDCNRDGYALRYAKERLLAEPGTRKLLMIVSDGSPNAHNYTGTAAAKDLREIVSECEKEDICILAAAIDSDKQTIKGIYGKDHFLDITNLELLPVLLANKIKALYQ